MYMQCLSSFLQRFVYDYRCLKGQFVGGGRSAIKCDPASHVAISLEPQSVSYSRDDLSIPLVEVADIEQQPIARHQRKITKLLRIPLFSQVCYDYLRALSVHMYIIYVFTNPIIPLLTILSNCLL